MNGADGFIETGFFRLVELDFNNALDALGADNDRNTHIHAFNAILALQVCGARQDAFLIIQISFGHLNGGTGRGIECGTGFQQANDFRTAIAGTLDNFVDTLLSRPLHVDQIGQRNTTDRGITGQRHHGVAMTAKDKCGNVLDGHLEFFGQEIAEAG